MTDSEDSFQQLVKRVGFFKLKRPKTPEQASRFFACKIVVPGTTCVLSGHACSQRHVKARQLLNRLLREEVSPVEIEMSGALPCADCEFGALRTELLKKRR